MVVGEYLAHLRVVFESFFVISFGVGVSFGVDGDNCGTDSVLNRVDACCPEELRQEPTPARTEGRSVPGGNELQSSVDTGGGTEVVIHEVTDDLRLVTTGCNPYFNGLIGSFFGGRAAERVIVGVEGRCELSELVPERLEEVTVALREVGQTRAERLCSLSRGAGS